MKRKLLLSILLCLFMCILNVSAEDSVKIKSIELVDKSEAVKELKEPTYKDLNLDLDLQLYKVGDFAEYKVTIENLTNDEVKIKNNGQTTTKEQEYLTYNYKWDNNDSTIPANKTKSFNLKVEYTNRIEDNSFNENDEYITTDNLKIEMSQEQQTIPTNNNKEKKQNKKEEVSPQTGDIVIDYIVLIVIGITLVFDIVYFAIIKKENKKLNKYILIGSFILLLISIIVKITYAFTYAEMNVNTKIKIKKLPVMMQACSPFSSYKFTEEDIIKLYNGEIDFEDLEENDSDCFNWSDIIGDMPRIGEYEEMAHNKEYPPDKELTKLIVTTTTEMPETYKFKDITYNLQSTEDLSENIEGSVIVGKYKNSSDGLLILLGGEGGVEAPTNSIFLFSGYESDYDYRKSNLLAIASDMDLRNLDTYNVLLANYMFSCIYYIDTFLINDNSFTNLIVASEMFEESGSFSKKIDIKLQLKSLSKLINFECMFYNFGSLSQTINLDLSGFDTSNVTDMYRMFYKFGENATTVNLNLSNFDTSKVTNMKEMFYMFGWNATSIDLDLSSFDTSNVIDMSEMFRLFGLYATSIDLDLSSFDTSNVTNMSEMFDNFGKNAKNLNLDLSSFDTSKVTDMYRMFASFGENATNIDLDLSSFDTTNVTDMSDMFFGFGRYTTNLNLDLSSFDTSNVTNMSYMFSCFGGKTLDLSSFDTSKVTDMSFMFYISNSLEKIYVGNKWNTSKVTSDYNMFYWCSNLNGGNGTTYNSSKTDKTYARIDTPDSPGYLTLKTN